MIYLQLFFLYCEIGFFYTVIAYIRHPEQFQALKRHTLGECIPIFLIACLTWPWAFLRRLIGKTPEPKKTNL